ncbi:hypothetical protein [Sphingomonas xinjiangensis]|uniref:Aspartyl protease n=1 Tax=Sphingomonas xinjiangensis TaxID=643568 RepID=A0A840YRS2_9SPHN|nr:hypothetical protein [Sphingomonas xinjiangensis]MBB5712333.1 hypothetical protein [Sphingomonas xinjiangensis]
MHIVVTFLIALLLSVPAAAQVQVQATPETSVKLEQWRSRWVLPVTIAGKPRRLLFDTAGGLTLLSRDTVTQAGCTPWGRLTGFRMFGDRGDTARCSEVAIELPGYRVAPPAVGLINLGKLNPLDAELDGLASLNMFDGKAITLDLASGELTIESEASLSHRVASMKALKVRLSREVQGLALAVLVEVPTSKGPVWMELDSGNGGTVLVGKHVAEFVGLDPNKQTKQRARFAIADGVEVQTADAFTPDIILDGNLGMPFLKNWIITLDLRRGLAWVAAAKRSAQQ